MREVSEKLREVLAGGGYTIEWVADLYYGGTPKAQNVPIVDPRFSWDMAAQVQGKGSCTVAWDDLFAQSIVPKEIGDMFSPFGAELQVDVIVSLGQFSERVPQGRFVLDAVPSSVEYAIQNPHGGLPLVVESTVELDLKDYFLRIARDAFAFPTSPKSTSMWDEAQRLTGLPLFQSIPDRILPANITYAEDRLNALEKVFSPSNAWPALTSAGALTAVPKDWTAPVGELQNVKASPPVMRSENVYNRVVVEGKNPDPNGAPLIAIAEIKDGLLRTENADGTRSPFGGATYKETNDLLTTQQACQRAADALLPRVSKLRSVTRRIVERLNPLREVGDVLLYDGAPVRIQSIKHADGETELEVEVRG